MLIKHTFICVEYWRDGIDILVLRFRVDIGPFWAICIQRSRVFHVGLDGGRWEEDGGFRKRDAFAETLPLKTIAKRRQPVLDATGHDISLLNLHACLFFTKKAQERYSIFLCFRHIDLSQCAGGQISIVCLDFLVFSSRIIISWSTVDLRLFYLTTSKNHICVLILAFCGWFQR